MVHTLKDENTVSYDVNIQWRIRGVEKYSTPKFSLQLCLNLAK